MICGAPNFNGGGLFWNGTVKPYPTLLLGPDSEYQRNLLESTRDRSNKLVAPSGREITELLLSPAPHRALAEILASQLAVLQLSPYHLGGGINRDSIFFGRQDIIAHIINRHPANYLVVGGRQLGKSSLLRTLERRYHGNPDVSCHYLLMGSDVLAPRMAHCLGVNPSGGLDAVAGHLAGKRERFLFLIDEADKLISRERRTGYEVLSALRRMSEEEHCNFINHSDRRIGARSLPPAGHRAHAKHAVDVPGPGRGRAHS